MACVGWSGMFSFYAFCRVHRFAAGSRSTGRRWLWVSTVIHSWDVGWRDGWDSPSGLRLPSTVIRTDRTIASHVIVSGRLSLNGTDTGWSS